MPLHTSTRFVQRLFPYRPPFSPSFFFHDGDRSGTMIIRRMDSGGDESGLPTEWPWRPREKRQDELFLHPIVDRAPPSPSVAPPSPSSSPSDFPTTITPSIPPVISSFLLVTPSSPPVVTNLASSSSPEEPDTMSSSPSIPTAEVSLSTTPPSLLTISPNPTPTTFASGRSPISPPTVTYTTAEFKTIIYDG